MSTPTIVKAIKYLRDSGASKSKQELAIIIGEREEYVNKALEKLVAEDLVTKEEGFYAYKATPRSEQVSNKLIEVYKAVGKRPAKELLIRGLICYIPSHYLFHLNALLRILEGEGFNKKELDEFIQQEINNGYLRRLRIAYIGIKPYPLPRYIPSYWFHQLKILGQDEYEVLKQEYGSLELREEDYLLGQYPAELANPAREYLEREKSELRDELRTTGLLSWLGGFR